MMDTDLYPTSKQRSVVWATGCVSLKFRREIPSGKVDSGISDPGDIKVLRLDEMNEVERGERRG